MPSKRGEAKASDKARIKRSHAPKGVASLPRRIWNDLKLYGLVFGAVGTFLGLLRLSPLANVSIVAASMLLVFVIRRDSTLIILRRLYLQSAFYAVLYAVLFLAVVVMIGYLYLFRSWSIQGQWRAA